MSIEEAKDRKKDTEEFAKLIKSASPEVLIQVFEILSSPKERAK